MEPPTRTHAHLDYSGTPRKRRRPALSCVQCRQRKVRCDRSLPCGPCIRARSSRELVCFYDGGNRPRQSTSSAQNPPQYSQFHQSTARLEPAVSLPSNEEQSDKSDIGQAEVPSQSHTSIEELQQRIDHLEGLISQKNAAPAPESSHSFVGHQLLKAPEPSLRISMEKTKLFGPNSWIHIADQFQVLGKLISQDVPFSDNFLHTDMTELTNVLKECVHYRILARKQRSSEACVSPHDLPSNFPPMVTCDKLVQAYMRTFEPVYRIFDTPSFWREYKKFWKDAESVSKHFVVKLALVLAIGSVFHSDQKSSPRREASIRNWIYAAQSWLIDPSDSASFSLDGIQIGCLLIISRMTGPLSTPLWISTGSLLQMAMSMGLHRDTSLFPSLTPFQVEMRNRLWTTVIELSTQALLDSGLPFPLILEEFDSRSPGNFNDADILSDSKGKLQPKEDNIFTDSSIQILLRSSVTTRLEIARLLNDPLRKNLTFERAVQLGQEIRAACLQVSEFFQLHIPYFNEKKNKNKSRMDFHRRFLDMYLHRYLVFLHRPFMAEARKDPRFYLSRKICFESCMVIASHADSLDLTNEHGDDLSRLICVGSGTFKGALCMDVITVLGLELVTQVEEEQSASNRLSSLRRSSSSTAAGTALGDPLGELARANRAPLVRCLERIRDQLEQIIIAGRPSLKRYTFIVGVLALAHAIDLGLPIKQNIYEAVLTSLKKCCLYLQEHSVARGESEISLENLSNDAAFAALNDGGYMASNPSVSIPMNAIDPNFDMEFSDFLMLPGLLETSGFDIRWGDMEPFG